MKMWLRLFAAMALLGLLLPMLVMMYMNSWKMSDPRQRSLQDATGRKVNYKSRQGSPLFSKRTQKRHRWQEHIQNICDKLNIEQSHMLSKKSLMSHILVNKRYKVLYCQVPKVACTNWRRLLIVLSGKLHVTDIMQLKAADVHSVYDKYLTYFSDLTPEEQDNALQNYFKFLIVREPFERILSAYRNKFQGQTNSSKFFHSRYGKKIVKRYRRNPSSRSLAHGDDVTFPEFVQYVIDPNRKEPLNEHWAQFFQLCFPCFIQYDFIGKYTDLEMDSKFILDSIGASSVVQFPPRSASYHHQKTENFMRQYYKEIPPHFLAGLWGVYGPDFELFNYSVPSSIKNLTSVWNSV